MMFSDKEKVATTFESKEDN